MVVGIFRIIHVSREYQSTPCSKYVRYCRQNTSTEPTGDDDYSFNQ
jgi:hypothetical protein